MISPDLDIFGDSDKEMEMGSDGSLDIFGDMASSGTETQSAEAEALEGEPEAGETVTEGTSDVEPVEGTEGDEPSETMEPTSEVDSELDIEKLFDEAEQEVQTTGNTELEAILDDMRKATAEKDLRIAQLEKSNEVLNSKLIGKAGDDADLSFYKPLVENLEADRKLMFLAKYWNSDRADEKATKRITSVLTDMVRELTGQDIAELIETAQNDKIVTSRGGKSDSAVPLGAPKEDDSAMTYEESITRMF